VQRASRSTPHRARGTLAEVASSVGTWAGGHEEKTAAYLSTSLFPLCSARVVRVLSAVNFRLKPAASSTGSIPLKSHEGYQAGCQRTPRLRYCQIQGLAGGFPEHIM